MMDVSQFLNDRANAYAWVDAYMKICKNLDEVCHKMDGGFPLDESAGRGNYYFSNDAQSIVDCGPGRQGQMNAFIEEGCGYQSPDVGAIAEYIQRSPPVQQSHQRQRHERVELQKTIERETLNDNETDGDSPCNEDDILKNVDGCSLGDKGDGDEEVLRMDKSVERVISQKLRAALPLVWRDVDKPVGSAYNYVFHIPKSYFKKTHGGIKVIDKVEWERIDELERRGNLMLKSLKVGAQMVLVKRRRKEDTYLSIFKITPAFDYLLDIPWYVHPDPRANDKHFRCSIPGVYWDKRSWIASWYKDGKRCYSSFSAKLHGFYKAKFFAVHVRLYNTLSQKVLMNIFNGERGR